MSITRENNKKLPVPGEIVNHDCRRGSSSTSKRDKLRIVQWNIERGYKLNNIIQTLKELDADIIAIQEIDIGCERSDHKDTGLEIAKALNLNCIRKTRSCWRLTSVVGQYTICRSFDMFVCEFEELHDPIREKHVQGGGVHGNGIMTKFDFERVWAIDHQHRPYQWERDGHLIREPRKGRRFTAAATIKTPDGIPVVVYSAHLEIFCGLLDRVVQFSEILADAKSLSSQYPHQMILGDLNTMAHSIARLSAKYCRDKLRWRTIGKTEAEWWVEHLFNFHVDDGEINTKLKRFGLAEAVLRNARNDSFFDPFDVYEDSTIYSYWGLFQGKLDWTLLRGFAVLNKGIGNHDYSASDHKYLFVDVLVDKSAIARRAIQRRRQIFTAYNISVATVILLLALLVQFTYRLCVQ